MFEEVKKVKILLVCNAGMSTSLLVEKMKKEATNLGHGDAKIDAETIDENKNIIENYDVVLLGPQVRFQEDYVKQLCGKCNKKYGIIPSMMYGMVDGKKTFEFALEILKEG